MDKGLDALLHNPKMEQGEIIREIKVKELRPNPYQPRKIFTEEAIEELKQSIVAHGIFQPIIARKTLKGYEIIVGERRYRAACEAGLQTVPTVIRSVTEQQMMELAILENLQREDLNPIEEALAYQMLLERLPITQDELAKRLGKSRPYITNYLRLLSLPEEIKQDISAGTISMGHGRALLALKDKEKLKELVKKVIQETMNVRQLEHYIQQFNEHVICETKTKEQPKKSLFIKQRETSLREKLGTAVTIKQSKKKGKIEIEFFSTEDLERIIDLLTEQSGL